MKEQTRTIPIAQPVTGEEEWQALREPLEKGWLTSGPKVREFEEAFAKRHEVEHAIACTSATSALHLSLSALGVGEGDEVIVPAFTWVATANAVLYCGAKPVFADIELETFNFNPKEVERKLSKRTKAIIPVHLFGLCADMDAIKDAAPGIPLIEDGACAAGASYKDVPAGALGDLGCFSFHPRKSITTGEGGMVTTNDPDLAHKVEVLRNHGASVSEEQRHHGPKPYLMPEFEVMGYNYRMTDMQGAIGVVQLGKLDRFIDERNEMAGLFKDQLEDIEWLQLPQQPEGYRHGWQSYVTLVDLQGAPFSRNEIMEKLQGKGVSTRPGTHSVPTLAFYKERFALEPSSYPNALIAHEQSMAIPLHNRMGEVDIEYVVEVLSAI